MFTTKPWHFTDSSYEKNSESNKRRKYYLGLGLWFWTKSGG